MTAKGRRNPSFWCNVRSKSAMTSVWSGMQGALYRLDKSTRGNLETGLTITRLCGTFEKTIILIKFSTSNQEKLSRRCRFIIKLTSCSISTVCLIIITLPPQSRCCPLPKNQKRHAMCHLKRKESYKQSAFSMLLVV